MTAQTASPTATPPRHRRWLALGLVLLLLGAAAIVGAAILWLPTSQFAEAYERTPMQLVFYAERRLEGHPRLQFLASPLFAFVRRIEQREPPGNLPVLGKGQQVDSLAWPQYDEKGRPQPISRGGQAAVHKPSRRLTSVADLTNAVETAHAGDVLEIEPGTYRLTSSLTTSQPGEPSRPIVLRAGKPGQVVIESTATEAIVVSQPYWLFENLELRGVCAQHDDCEHAFHIVAGGRSAVLLNNRLVDFNSPVKINGQAGGWPDDGLLQFNTLTNTVPRRTDAPVSFVDLVGASGWRITDNHVERFVKDGSNRISYGLCVKGGGRQTFIARNLVLCTPENLWQPGSRVGISLGCGATGAPYCREGSGTDSGRCAVEQFDGVVVNNVVAHCNDSGIDLHRARGALVSQNTLVNTAGIDVRRKGTTVYTYGNLVEGKIRARETATLESHADLVQRRLDRLLYAPMSLDLRWLALPELLRPTPENTTDFCGKSRPFASPPGATVQSRCESDG